MHTFRKARGFPFCIITRISRPRSSAVTVPSGGMSSMEIKGSLIVASFGLTWTRDHLYRAVFGSRKGPLTLAERLRSVPRSAIQGDRSRHALQVDRAQHVEAYRRPLDLLHRHLARQHLAGLSPVRDR